MCRLQVNSSSSLSSRYQVKFVLFYHLSRKSYYGVVKTTSSTEKVVRTPTEPALIAAIEEIAEEEYQCEAGETVEVEVPDRAPEPSTAADQAPDSGVGTLAESKPRVTENAGAGKWKLCLF